MSARRQKREKVLSHLILKTVQLCGLVLCMKGICGMTACKMLNVASLKTMLVLLTAYLRRRQKPLEGELFVRNGISIQCFAVSNHNQYVLTVYQMTTVNMRGVTHSDEPTEPSGQLITE